MSNYDVFKTKFESKISIHDKRKVSASFASMTGLPASIKQADKMILLGPGQPSELLFPFKEINITYRDSPGKLGVKDNVKSDQIEKHITIPMYRKNETESDIAASFQYQASKGSDELLLKTREIIEALHKPGYKDWGTVLTSGSSDSMNKTFALLVDEETTVLCEEFSYPNVFHNCSYHSGQLAPLKMNVTDNKDEQGINIEYLKDLLENFENYYPGRKKKLVLYTIATGHNPTALTECFAKRKQIYNLCLKHNVFILEDDPYGYLQLPKYNKADPLHNPYEASVTLSTFTEELLVPSYITLDTEGIVLRLETFSKVASPGFRLGFVVANSYFISRLENINYLTNRNPSGASQSFLNNFLNELSTNYQSSHPDARSIDGWIDWCMKIASEYTNRRNVLFKALYETEAYKKGLFKLLEPSCGMFASVVVDLKTVYTACKGNDPQEKINKIKRAMDYLFCCLLEAGTVTILGYKMTVCKNFSMERATFLRITFAKASSEEEFERGAIGLSQGIITFFNEYMTKNERWDLLPAGLEGM